MNDECGDVFATPDIVKKDVRVWRDVSLPMAMVPIDTSTPVAVYDPPSFIAPIIRNPMRRYVEPDEAPIYAPNYDIRYWTVTPRDLACSEVQDEDYPTALLVITGDMDGAPDSIESMDTEIATVSGMTITYGMKAGTTAIRVYKDGIYKEVKVSVTAAAGGGGVWLAYTGE